MRFHHPRRRASLLTLGFLASLASPPVSSGPEEPRQTPLIQREEVRFVTLDLVVEDHRSGKWRRTTDLRQEQLKVLVGGKEIQLDSFESYCPDAAVAMDESPSARQPEAEGKSQGAGQDVATPDVAGREVHRYVLYFDLEHLTLAGRSSAFRAAAEWAKESVDPTDEVMIVTGGMSLRITRPLLPASRRLQEDIQAATEDVRPVDMWADGERLRLDEIARARTARERQVLADSYARMDFDYTRRGLDLLRQVMAIFDSIPGIKNLILFSETLRQVPGSIYGADPQILFDVNAQMQAVARDASDKNVRIYAVQAGGLGRDVEDTMTFLSTETGGDHLEGTNRLAGVFDQARADLDCFYRVGFRLPARQSGQTERIWVRIPEDESKYRLRYRRTLDDPSREQREEASIRAAYLRPSAAKGFPVGVEVTRLKREELGARFRVQVLVPLEGLTALPGPDPAHREVRLEVGGLIVPLIRTARTSEPMEDHDVWTDVDVSRKSLKFSRQATLRVPVARPTGARGRKAGLYTREFLAPPGLYRLVFVASDLNGHTVAAAVSEFESAPPASMLGAAMLGFEGQDLIPLPAEEPKVEGKKQKPWNGKDLEDAAPEIGTGMLLASRPGIGTERSLWAVYEVCRPDSPGAAASKRGVSASSSGTWRLDRMLDCLGKSLELPELSVTPPADGGPCVVVSERVSSSDLPPGSCRLSVVLSHDGRAEQPRDLEFRILPPPSESTPAKAP